MNKENKKIEVEEIVTLIEEGGEFIVEVIHLEKNTADLTFVAGPQLKLKGVPISDLDKIELEHSKPGHSF